MAEERKDNCCCDEKEQIRQFVSEDWRRGEKRVKEDCDGKVTEVYLEPLKLNLFQRIKEDKCPIVCHRETETYDETGKVIDKVVEDIDPSKQLQVVDRVVARQEEPAPLAPETTGFATKDDLQNVVSELKGAIETLGEVHRKKSMVNTVSAQNMLEDTVKNANTETITNAIFLGAFIIEAVILGWVVFLMP